MPCRPPCAVLATAAGTEAAAAVGELAAASRRTVRWPACSADGMAQPIVQLQASHVG